MASSSSGCEKLESVVTCALCYEIFTSPKTFTCFHSYCEACINKLKHDTTRHAPGYKCPLCRRFCAVTDIKPNFLMNELVELYRLTLDGGAVRACTQCKATNPDWRCLDCKIDFCAECKEGHTRVPLLRGHRLMANKDINETFLVDKLIFCHIHNDKPIEFNCKVCDLLLCITCKVVDHDCHKTETISTALDRIVPKIHSDIRLVSSYIEDAEKRIASLTNQKGTSTTNFTQVKSAMEKRKDALIRKILDDHSALVELIDAEEAERTKEFDSTISNIEDEIKEQRHMITWANTSLQAAQGASLLFEIQSGLGNKLSDMASENPRELPKITDQSVTFEENKEPFGPSNILGTVKLPRREETRQNKGEGESEKIQVEVPNADRAWNFSITHLPQSNFRIAQKIDVIQGHLCYRFAIINDQLWLPIYNKNCILVYSFCGELARTMRFQKLIKRPKAVTAQNESDAIVSSQTGLFVIQQSNGDIRQQVCAGQFSDLCVREYSLTALEWKTGKIHVFTKNNNSWDHVTNIDASYGDCHIGDTFLCANENSDDDVYITCSWQKHTIYRYSSPTGLDDTPNGSNNSGSLSEVSGGSSNKIANSGKTSDQNECCDNHNVHIDGFRTTSNNTEGHNKIYHLGISGKISGHAGGPGETEPGQLYCPNLCGMDKNGSILVADCGNHRIQMLDSETRWNILKPDGLHCPWDLHFEDKNTIWVLNNEKFLIKYKLTQQ